MKFNRSSRREPAIRFAKNFGGIFPAGRKHSENRIFMIIKHPIILIVEDDVNDQFLMKTAFKKIGMDCPIYTVGDGTEAVAYLKGEGAYADRAKFRYPTLLTIDLKMPRMNGFELLAFLKQNPNFMVVP